MVFMNIAPSWFFGYDIALELIFAIILIVIASFAFRIYKKTSEKKIALFGASFLLIAISYLIQSVFNFMTLYKLNEQVCQVIKIQSVIFFNNAGLIVHIFLMTVGLAILTFITFKDKSYKLLWLLLVLSLSAVFLSGRLIYAFYLVSTIFLIFIEWHFVSNYLKNRQTKTLLIALAFLFLLCGSFHFLASVNHHLFYAIGHGLELIAYVLIAINFYLVLKK